MILHSDWLTVTILHHEYCKCSKISNTFHFLFLNKMVFKAGLHKILVRIANKEDPDQTADSDQMLQSDLGASSDAV